MLLKSLIPFEYLELLLIRFLGLLTSCRRRSGRSTPCIHLLKLGKFFFYFVLELVKPFLESTLFSLNLRWYERVCESPRQGSYTFQRVGLLRAIRFFHTTDGATGTRNVYTAMTHSPCFYAHRNASAALESLLVRAASQPHACIRNVPDADKYTGNVIAQCRRKVRWRLSSRTIIEIKSR